VCVCVCTCVIGLRATRQNIMGLLATDGFANIVADLEKCASLLAGFGALETGRCLLTGFVCVCD